MPVDTHHKDTGYWLPSWRTMRHVTAGQRQLWQATNGDMFSYLPKLEEQTTAEYEAYKRRPAFYNATARTVDALTGAIFRRDPELVLSDQLEADFENIDLAGTPFDTFAQQAVQEVMITGRYGILLDVPPKGAPAELARPYWCPYSAEEIVNWHVERINGALVTTMVTLRECTTTATPGDEFGRDELQHYRVLDLDPERGIYRQRLFTESDPKGGAMVQVEEVYPNRAGEPLTEIPFVFLGPLTILPMVQKPPLLDLADTNLSHSAPTRGHVPLHALRQCADRVGGRWVGGRNYEDRTSAPAKC